MREPVKKVFSWGATAALLAMFAGCASSGTSNVQGGTASAKAYPLKTCIVTDDQLGSPDEVVAFSHNGQEIKLCCEGCKEDFDKDPGQYLKKLAGK